MKVLVVDIGGSHIKVGGSDRDGVVKLPSGPELTPARMAAAVRRATARWTYDVVTIGYPGAVMRGRPAVEPHNLGRGWVRFDYARAFGKPVRIVNDAAMQALGSYKRGRMLFLGLGTGLGAALVIDGQLAPLEVAHLPYRKRRTYEDYLGLRGLERLGRHRWRRHVAHVVELFRHALQVDYVVLGGGNVRKLDALPTGARLGDNANAMLGGVRLWPLSAGRHVSEIRQRR